MKHTCHAKGCTKQIPPSKLMCWPHWKQVDHHIQNVVNFEYTRGQEKSKTPTKAYLKIAQAAINSVAIEEGLKPPYPNAYKEYLEIVQSNFNKTHA